MWTRLKTKMADYQHGSQFRHPNFRWYLQGIVKGSKCAMVLTIVVTRHLYPVTQLKIKNSTTFAKTRSSWIRCFVQRAFLKNVSGHYDKSLRLPLFNTHTHTRPKKNWPAQSKRTWRCHKGTCMREFTMKKPGARWRTLI